MSDPRAGNERDSAGAGQPQPERGQPTSSGAGSAGAGARQRPTGTAPRTTAMSAEGGGQQGGQMATQGGQSGLRRMRGQAAPGMQTGASLTTEAGSTRIANAVVAKIAGLSPRDIPGVYSMGTGMARRVGQLRALIPGGDESSGATQGVAVEVGEREAAIDLDIVTWYGQSIVDISEAVRRNVAGQVQGMTGLTVVEVNINVDDIHVESDTPQPTQRVQ